MQCQLRLIRNYPFQIEKQTNPMMLTLTCLADKNTASALQIESHGYRYLVGPQQEEILVLIVINPQLQSKQNSKVLHVPFNIFSKFQDGDKNVKIVRKPLAMLSSLYPSFPEAKEVNIYFNSTFKVDPAIISVLSAGNYAVKSGQYYLDSIWLSGFLKLFNNLQAQLEWSLLIKEHQKKKRSSYLRCYIQVIDQQHSRYCLFKKGVTKINIKQIDLHPYNIYKTTQTDQLNKKIYELQPYSQTIPAFKELLNTNSIAILQSQKNIGLDSFLEDLCQNVLKINYESIDCNEVPSFQEFYRKLEWISNLDASLVLVRNIEWIAELYQAEQILNFEIKHIAKNVEEIFNNIQNKTPRKYVLVIETEATAITDDMFQKCKKITIEMDKALKMVIFQLVFNHFDAAYSRKDEILQVCHDKFGWQKFKDFMEREWKRIKHKEVGDILKEISKLIKQEQVQNLIEVSWDDVGGLEAAKEEIIQTILLPIRHPQIFDQWIKPRTGLLFYGPPGTGKTLLGKCIAKQCKMSFISVKGPQLLNMYVGQSEKNVRQVFERAAACKPCIVFMDQLDALIPKRGNNSDSHQVMDRIVAELLVQMDLASANQVFIIGATNRPDLLDPSIMRPGRFDKQIYLGITKNKQDKIKILKAQTRQLTISQNIDWEQLLEKIPQNFTGADFYGLTSKAVMVAAERTIEEFQQGIEHQKIKIEEKDFLSAAQKVKPSVSEVQLRRYQQLKKIYS